MAKKSRYSDLIERIFEKNYKPNAQKVTFERTDFVKTAAELNIELPLNLGDIVYSFRYRTALPTAITATAPAGNEWVIRPVGQARYEFSLTDLARFIPNLQLTETKIPDATPGIIKCYAMDDEQGLLAKVRYNRLIDIFTGVTCHSLQNHFRTTVPGIGQVETDEIYVGIDKRGAQYIFPVQAKGGTDQLGVVQIEQDFALCRAKFPNLIAIPIATQFLEPGLIAMFTFEQDEDSKKVRVSSERHYRLVLPDGISEKELNQYKQRVTE